MSWLDLLGAAFAGGFAGAFVVKLLDIGYQEFRGRFERKLGARRFVDENLDPVLKAADELAAKLGALAKSDFRPLRGGYRSHMDNHDFGGLLFMLANFWACVERFRRKGLSVSITQDDRGQTFASFTSCLESRMVRLVDRMSQRAIAESILIRRDGDMEVIAFIDFVRKFEDGDDVRRWLDPIVRILTRTKHTSVRQKLLQYGAVLHAMIDTLDPKHRVTRKRPAYTEKLSKRTWRNLKYRVFGVYLTSVTDPEKYLGPPKRRP